MSPSASEGDICPFPQPAPTLFLGFPRSTCDILSPPNNESGVETQKSYELWVWF